MLADRCPAVMVADMDEIWDCIVIGGGAAGLSAALVLGRARRRTLVVDAGGQSNLPAHGIGGLLGHDGRPPSALYAIGREELARYPAVELRDGSVAGARPVEGGFEVTLAGGAVERARTVLLAAGMAYRTAEVEGIAERWGHSAFHCPFCHGWEVRDQALGVLDRGPSAVHRALLLRAWSDDVTVYANGPAGLDDASRASLRAAGVAVDERPVVRLLGGAPALRALELADGTEVRCEGLLVAVTLHQRDGLAAELGLALAEPTPLSAEAIAVDDLAHASVPGVYVAGDLRGRMPSVAGAVADGSLAASSIVRDLVEQGLVGSAL
jgi:thioredoxin reductase